MTQNPFGQTHQNMHTGSVPQQMNHGGHELFDVHEVLSGAIASLNMAMLMRPHVKDPELLDILDRQYRFTLDEYNITVECFKTGRDPSHPTQSYKMKQGNDFIYGMKASQPKNRSRTSPKFRMKSFPAFYWTPPKRVLPRRRWPLSKRPTQSSAGF